MNALELAFKYMDIFYSGKNVEDLNEILHKDLQFQGPFCTFQSSDDYIHSLKKSPPKNMSFHIIQTYYTEDSACLIYEFQKPGISIPMAQHFEIKDTQIVKILLLFDSKEFSNSSVTPELEKEYKNDVTL